MWAFDSSIALWWFQKTTIVFWISTVSIYTPLSVQLLPLLASYSSSPAVGGSTSDSCALIGWSRRRLPWHSGCCTESVPQHQQAADLHPPHYPSLFFLLLCLSSSHRHPCSLFSLPSPLPLTGLLKHTAAEDVHTPTGIAAAAAGGLVGVLRPVSLPPAAQARHCVLLCSPSRTICLRSVCVCVLVRAGIWKVGREGYHTLGALPLPKQHRVNVAMDIFIVTSCSYCTCFCLNTQGFILCISLLELIFAFPSLCSSGICFSID